MIQTLRKGKSPPISEEPEQTCMGDQEHMDDLYGDYFHRQNVQATPQSQHSSPPGLSPGDACHGIHRIAQELMLVLK